MYVTVWQFILFLFIIVTNTDFSLQEQRRHTDWYIYTGNLRLFFFVFFVCFITIILTISLLTLALYIGTKTTHWLVYNTYIVRTWSSLRSIVLHCIFVTTSCFLELNALLQVRPGTGQPPPPGRRSASWLWLSRCSCHVMLLLVGTVRGLQITVTAQEPDLVFVLKRPKKRHVFFSIVSGCGLLSVMVHTA